MISKFKCTINYHFQQTLYQETPKINAIIDPFSKNAHILTNL